MTQEELNKILDNHLHWLNQDCDCWQIMRADLRVKDLSHLDLRGRDLRRIILRGVDLSFSNLSCANLSGADCSWSDFCCADLHSTNFEDADLLDVNFSGANLNLIKLKGAKNIPFIPMACPDEGAFTGWKLADYGSLIKFTIPEDAKRSSGTSGLCRCDKAMVEAIYNPDGTPILSASDSRFMYKVGETIIVPNYCEDRFNVLGEGIHFFINRKTAINN